MSRREHILSPTEVQALLGATQPPDEGRGVQIKAEPIDLLADDRHLRLMIPTLSVGFARIAESLRRVLTSVLRRKVEIHDEPPEVLSGRGLVSVAERAACLIVLRIRSGGPDSHFGILSLDPILTFSVIERLFGGGGGPPHTPSGRSPTSLERQMLLRALAPVIDALNRNLEPQGHFVVDVHQVESRLELVPGYAPDIAALHVPFTMTIGGQLASLSLAIPAGALESLRGKLTAPIEGAVTEMPIVVRRVGVCVSVELGQASMPLRQVLALEPGMVLTLDRNRSDELPVQLEGVTKFRGIPVEDDGALAVEITKRNER